MRSLSYLLLFFVVLIGFVLTVQAQQIIQNDDGLYQSGDLRFPPDAFVDDQLRGGWRKRARWPNGIVIYRLDQAFTSTERAEIFKGMNEISSKTCIRFQERRNHADYVDVVRANGGGCWSMFGRVGGRQEMNLEPFCVRQVTVAHEFIHSLGFVHEQSRPDRDNYITINWKNIIPNQGHNFNKFSHSEIDTFGTPYDFDSIMHYPRFAFAINPNIPTITPKVSGTNICGECRISRLDAMEINLMYKDICPSRIK